MVFSFDLLFEALLFGVLLGCFYAAVSIGLSVSFGLLDVPHVAHPAVMVLGSYFTYILAGYGLDPIVAGVVLMPAFFVLGILMLFSNQPTSGMSTMIANPPGESAMPDNCAV